MIRHGPKCQRAIVCWTGEAFGGSKLEPKTGKKRLSSTSGPRTRSQKTSLPVSCHTWKPMTRRRRDDRGSGLSPYRSIKRTRATKSEVEARREALLDIIEAGRPMTVRQVFYQATVRGLVEKAESGYGKVKTDLIIMRRDGSLAYDWLADNTRWQRKPRTFQQRRAS